MINFIWVTIDKPMLHKYKDAPQEVGYLRNLHRHLFKFKVYIAIAHQEREIEFIMFKTFIRKVVDRLPRLLQNNASCENMAVRLHEEIIKHYKGRDIKIEVSEDGENGVEYYFSSFKL
jgi:6-pyruvoyl-tetrahydropterin synthase